MEANNLLTLNEIVAIEESASQKNILTKPVYRPKGNQVFVFKIAKSKDYLRDGYRWTYNGRYVPRAAHKVKHKSYFNISYPKDKSGSFPVARARGSTEFQKFVYEFKNSSKVVVQYLGNELCDAARERPHHNAKNLKRNFYSITRGAHKKIENLVGFNVLTKQTPHNMYGYLRQNRKKSRLELPTGSKQIHNKQYKLRQQYKLLEDPLLTLFEFARQRPDFVLHFELYPSLILVVGNRQMLTFVRQSIASESSLTGFTERLHFAYDTTFNLTKDKNLYVSPLIFRNVFTESTQDSTRKDPIFPVMFLIHQSKNNKAHDVMWRQIVLHLGVLPLDIPITLDREQAIRNAIEKHAPNSPIVFCTNHILKDIRRYCASVGVPAGPVTNSVRKILNSATEAIYDAEFEKANWPSSVQEYLASHIFADAKRASKFYSGKFAAFKDKLPTNNASESFNATLKQTAGKNYTNVDTLVLVLYQIQNDYMVAMQEVLDGRGLYQIKSKYAENEEILGLLSVFKSSTNRTLIDRINKIKNVIYDLHMSTRETHDFLADRVRHLVTFYNHKYFVPSAIASSGTCTVVLSKTKNGLYTCDCLHSQSCYHITAIGHSNKYPTNSYRLREVYLIKQKQKASFSSADIVDLAVYEDLSRFTMRGFGNINLIEYLTLTNESNLSAHTIETMIQSLIDVSLHDRAYIIKSEMHELATRNELPYMSKQFFIDKIWMYELVLAVFQFPQYQNQWTLGVICQTTKRILIFDSSHMRNEAEIKLICKLLLRYTQVIAATAGFNQNFRDYEVSVALDCPKLVTATYDSGLHVIFVVYSIVNSLPYVTCESSVARKWVYRQLTKYKKIQHTRLVRHEDLVINSRNLEALKHSLESVVAKGQGAPLGVHVKAAVPRETKNGAYWIDCGNETCDGSGEYLMCTVCRNWFHEECKTLVDSNKDLDIYFCDCDTEMINLLVTR